MDDLKKHVHDSREDWLMAATAALTPHFKAAGFPLPEKMRFSVSFPWQGSRSAVIGQHFPISLSKDGTHEMLIHPKLDDAKDVLSVLAHELAHAAAPVDAKHGPKFAKIGKAVLLVGKPKSMEAGEEFFKVIGDKVLRGLGKYPHASFNAHGRGGMKKQSTRLIKCECAECGYIARVSMSWIEGVGAPVCPADEIAMEVAE